MGKRILITSIPCWNHKTGSNTFSSLFEEFDSKDLANIYIGTDLPDSKVCDRYFGIKEWQVVRSVYKKNIITGEEIFTHNDSVRIIETPDRSKQFARKRRRVFLWMREIAWKLGNWNSKELNTFLDDFKPEVLVFPIESYLYFNRLNEYIIKKCKPKKVIGYLWDDNFTYKQHPNSLLHKVERYFLRKQVKRLVGLCTEVLAISPKMKAECDAQFRIDSKVITKPLSLLSSYHSYKVSTPIKILYTGKLIIGREHTLLNIVECIQKLGFNSKSIIIDIYTNTTLPFELKNRIISSGVCVFHEPVSQSKVLELQKNADVLLFLESLSDRDLTARLSFSTKLTDYFSAGRCIWAVGNQDLGPISYIKEENAGIVSTDIDSIYAALHDFLHDPKVIEEYSYNAYYCGIKNHNPIDIKGLMHSIIDNK